MYPKPRKVKKIFTTIIDKRSLVLIARTIANIAQLEEKYKLYLIEEEWIDILKY